MHQTDKNVIVNYDDYEVSINRKTTGQAMEGAGMMLLYAAVGLFFGIVLVKSEVISWFRIQEMFRLQSFHMYGVIGSAIAVGMLSLWIIKKFRIRTVSGDEVDLTPKKTNKGQVYGGLIFGMGWAITGACPGPLYALLGSGFSVIIVPLVFAIIGTFVYAMVQKKLPH